jgi:hypothetical protein
MELVEFDGYTIKKITRNGGVVKKSLALFVLLTVNFLAVAADTELSLYQPFGEERNQASIQVVQTMQGECYEQSRVDRREGAWRCIVGSMVLDPCFVKIYGDRKEALCPHSPWNGQAIKIIVNQSLDNSKHQALDMSINYPWALELVDGTQCQKLPDSNQMFDNQPIRYRCNNQSVLFGRLQRCKTEWSMLQKKQDNVETVSIKQVWF